MSAPDLAHMRATASVREIAERYTDLKLSAGKLWGCCPIHAESTPSFKVNTERNAWICFGCAEEGGKHKRGDALDLVMAVEGLAFGPACRRLRELTGTTGSDPVADRHRAARQAEARAKDEAERARRTERALEVWRGSVPLPWRVPSEGQRYLREQRGITSWPSNTVRWHPACPWGEGGATAGCVVVPVHDVHGLVMGIHRIRPDGEGRAKRWALGRQAGGCCRLFDAAAEVLVIAEGIEDALAAREITGWPAWATVSAGGMENLDLPRFTPGTCLEIVICADGDERGLAAARTLAGRMREQGREARVVKPAAGKDPNDVLLARGAA